MGVDVAHWRPALVSWFEQARRDLPWRRTTDPYAIWVSEVMLQQTRVDTVIPFYESFLARFPTVESLAHASPEEVRARWSGLGYYRRAQQLHDAAGRVVAEHGSRLPSDPDALAALPGFGPYTVGAVASIAFDHPMPALDGNVKRVLARFHAIDGSLERRPASTLVREAAEAWVDGPRPGRTNEALMELGATVCRPSSPTCLVCPLRDGCQARARGETARIPPPRSRAAPKAEHLQALVVRAGNAVLLAPRSTRPFEGLWCPPMGEADLTPASMLAAYIDVTPDWVEAGRIEHVLTHRRLLVRLWMTEVERQRLRGRGRWVSNLEELGVPSFTAKILRHCLPGRVFESLGWQGRRGFVGRPPEA